MLQEGRKTVTLEDLKEFQQSMCKQNVPRWRFEPEITPINWKQRLFLFFIKPKYITLDGTVIKYKWLKGKLFILDWWFEAPKQYNCKCVIIDDYEQH